MSFRKFDHVCRVDHPDVAGLMMGKVHVFPKLDGTNAQVWMDEDFDGILRTGSRNRDLTEMADEKIKDNHGFRAWVHTEASRFHQFFDMLPDGAHVYGEWLVPHSLKTYREDAWRKFYIFDVWNPEMVEGMARAIQGYYLTWEEYESAAHIAGLDCIAPLCTIRDPSPEQMERQVEGNTYLIQDGCGLGEGVVFKNYEWANKHGRQPWAKFVRNEFKEENRRVFGAPEKDGAIQVEGVFAERYVTQGRVSKIRAKVLGDIHSAEWAADRTCTVLDTDTLKGLEELYRGKLIPRLLQTVYHDVIEEELWGFLKTERDPTINFKTLRQWCIRFTKQFAGDLF